MRKLFLTLATVMVGTTLPGRILLASEDSSSTAEPPSAKQTPPPAAPLPALSQAPLPAPSRTLSRELSRALSGRFAKTPADRRREADKLLELHAKVLADKGLSTTERERWLARLKGRLSRLASDLRREAAARGGGAQDDGQALVELIQATIAPQTWDVNGGQGTIRYWPAWHVLVVRQTEDVHEQIGGVVHGLRQ